MKQEYLKRAVEHLEEMKGRRADQKDEAATYAVSYRKLSEEQNKSFLPREL